MARAQKLPASYLYSLPDQKAASYLPKELTLLGDKRVLPPCVNKGRHGHIGQK